VESERRNERLEQWRRDLETYKREINLVEYAISRGYELRKKECYRKARVLKHPADQHKIVVSRDATDGHWVYFAIAPGYEESTERGLARTADNGTIVDFMLNRVGGRLDMKDVHAECRRWLGRPDPVAAQPGLRRRSLAAFGARSIGVCASVPGRAGRRDEPLFALAGAQHEDVAAPALPQHLETGRARQRALCASRPRGDLRVRTHSIQIVVDLELSERHAYEPRQKPHYQI